MNILVGDIETDGLNPDIIWMVGVLDFLTDEYTCYSGDRVAEGIVRLAEADLLIGHNIIGYDVKHMERLTGGLVTFDRSRIVDTLTLGKKLAQRGLFEAAGGHSLKNWGNLFGFPKGDHSDWSRFSEEMSIYCKRDCLITKYVYEFLVEISGDYAVMTTS